jgi:hypothetical protein
MRDELVLLVPPILSIRKRIFPKSFELVAPHLAVFCFRVIHVWRLVSELAGIFTITDLNDFNGPSYKCRCRRSESTGQSLCKNP